MKKLLRVTPEMLKEVDEWRLRQEKVVTLTEAIRMLIDIGLSWGKKKGARK